MPFSQQSEAPSSPDESLLRIIEAIIVASRQNAAEQHGGAASEASNAPRLQPAGVELRTGAPGGAAQLQDAAGAENPPAICWTNDSSAGSRLLLPLLLLQAAGARDTTSNGAMIDPNNSSDEPWSRPLPEHGGGVPPHDNLKEGDEQVPGWSDAGGGSPLRTALLNALLFLDRLRATATTPTAPPYLLPATQNMSPDAGSQSSNCVVLENFLQHVMRAGNQQQQDCGDSTGTRQFLLVLPLLLQAVAMYCGAASTIDPASAGGAGSSASGGRRDPNMVWLESEPPSSSSPCWSSSVPEQRPRGASHDSNYAVVPHEVLGLSSDTGTLRTVLDDLLSHVRAAAADAAATTYLRSALNAAGGDPGSSSSTTTTSTSGAAAPAAQSHDDEPRAESPDWNAIRLQQLLLPLLMQMTGAGINLNDVARDMMMSNRSAAAVASAEYEEDFSREDCPMWRLVGLAPPFHPVLGHLEHGPGGGALQDRYHAIVPHAGIEHAGIPLTASNNRSSSEAPPPVAAAAAASTPLYLLPGQQDSSMAGEGGMTYTQDSHGEAGWNPTGISSVFLPLSLKGAGIATTTWPRAAAGSSKNTPARASTAEADHTIDDDHSSLSGTCTTMLKTEHQEELSCVPDELGGAASQKKNAETTILAAVTSSHGAAPYTGYTQDRNGRKSLVKPAKRLSAYNIFFSEERLRILAQLNGDKDDDDPTSCSNSQPPNMANNLAALQEHRRNKCKRKPHHTIGFRELGMIISARWRKVTAAERAMYQEKAEQDRVRFSTELEVYTQAQQEDLTCRQRELEESVDQRTRKRYFAD